ncbi:uncharacterized protein [Halyomorpha halys]|uniref:uncharacterized protein n=1 Tax=Halyomorpha halys TaxID=286706 RepID=UPI0006D4D940|nr:Odorant-binding protein 36 [Halyomorpha halys]
MKITKMVQKCLLVLTACVLGAIGSQIDDRLAFKIASFNKCQMQENVPDDIMDDLFHSRNIEEIEDYKCVSKCLMEEYHTFENGKINVDNLTSALKGHWEDTAVGDRIVKGSIDCVNSVKENPDVCVYTYEFFLCLEDVLTKENTEF